MDISKEHALETYKSLVHFGSTGLKFVLTSNGAAAIAVLTFLGHFIASGKSPAPDLRFPLGVFLLGVLFGGLATITGYFTQLSLYDEATGQSVGKSLPSHTFWLYISIGLILLGVVAFGVGSLCAVSKLH